MRERSEEGLVQQLVAQSTVVGPGPSFIAVERRHLTVEPLPVEMAGEMHQLVFEVHDLTEARLQQRYNGHERRVSIRGAQLHER